MLDHVSIAVADFDRAAPFYESVMAALGVPRVWREADAIGFGIRNSGADDGHTYLTVRHAWGASPEAFDCPPRHWCFRAPDHATVDAFHSAGLANGGKDDGAPGLRPRYHADYYAAFLIDPDGNRVEAVCHHAIA